METGASAVIHFSTGVRGMVEAGICSRPGYQRMLVYGSEGQIEISGTDSESEIEANMSSSRTLPCFVRSREVCQVSA